MVRPKTAKTKEVQLTLDTNGIINWRNDKGVIIEGLKKEHFLSNAPSEKKNEAKKQFFLYMVEFKKANAAKYQEKVNALLEQSTDYVTKANSVGREPTDAEKLQAKRAKLEKQLTANIKAMKELGLES